MIALIHSNASSHDAAGETVQSSAVSPATQSVGAVSLRKLCASTRNASDEIREPIHRTYDGWTPRRAFLW